MSVITTGLVIKLKYRWYKLLMNVCSITKGELMYVANEIHDQQSYPENKRIAVQSAGISFFFLDVRMK